MPGRRGDTEPGPFLTAMPLAPTRLRILSLTSELGDPSSSLTPLCSTQGGFTQHLLSAASPPSPGSPEVKTSLSKGCCVQSAGYATPAPNSSETGSRRNPQWLGRFVDGSLPPSAGSIPQVHLWAVRGPPNGICAHPKTLFMLSTRKLNETVHSSWFTRS